MHIPEGWYVEEDEFGKWLTNGFGRIRVEASEGNDVIIPQVIEPPEPTQEEYMMDLDYRLSLIELGLQEG